MSFARTLLKELRKLFGLVSPQEWVAKNRCW
jgi:hypothetical protein